MTLMSSIGRESIPLPRRIAFANKKICLNMIRSDSAGLSHVDSQASRSYSAFVVVQNNKRT